jgi:hypothetical protein
VLRIRHSVVVAVLTAGRNCCHSLVVSIEEFDCSWDLSNQNMIVAVEEVLGVTDGDYVMCGVCADCAMD